MVQRPQRPRIVRPFHFRQHRRRRRANEVLKGACHGFQSPQSPTYVTRTAAATKRTSYGKYESAAADANQSGNGAPAPSTATEEMTAGATEGEALAKEGGHPTLFK